jgi:predicted permease
LFTTTTLAVGLGRPDGGRWYMTLAKTLRSVLLNPIVLGALSGLAFGLTGLHLPGVADDTLSLIGRAAAPVSLFAVGATLASCKIAGDLRESVTMSLLKLLLLPILVFISTHFIFGVKPEWVTVAVIAGAMPAGANVYVFARKFDVYVQRATAIVVISTVGSVVTLTALVATLPAP